MNADDPVVIVGMAVEAPGGVDSAESYWQLLSSGREALSTFPEDRGWAVRDLLAGSRRDGFKRIHNRGGFLSGAALFDPSFFGISPMQRIVLGWQANPMLEQVGPLPSKPRVQFTHSSVQRMQFAWLT